VTAPERPGVGAGRLVVVLGATGRQGGALTRALLAEDWRVRGTTRGPASEHARALAVTGAEVAAVDPLDPSLDKAFSGAHGVFSMQPAGVEAERELALTNAVADAAARAGVRHFVYSSSAGAVRSGTGVANYEVKWLAAQHLATLGMPYTVVRPVTFMENYLLRRDRIEAGELGGPFAGTMRQQLIAIPDIAAVVAAVFARPEETAGEELDLAGDELTLEGVAAVFARALDRPVRYARQVEDTVGHRDPEQMRALLRWREEEGHNVNILALRERCAGWSVELKTLEQWIGERWIGESWPAATVD
jgi:uncharacterized protein YbjT (DUF2867 family)